MRNKLLPPPFRDLEVWKDFADAIDEVFKPNLDDIVISLKDIRNTNAFDVDNFTVVQGDSSRLTYDKTTLIKQAKFIGFDFYDPRLIQEKDYRLLCDTLGWYYQEAGTKKFIDYFSFVFNALFTISHLWTNDYVSFYPEGSVEIGTPVHLGGTWYPTSHVDLIVDDAKYGLFDQESVHDLFKYAAPINLVLRDFSFESLATFTPLYASMAGTMYTLMQSTEYNTSSVAIWDLGPSTWDLGESVWIS